MQLSDIEQRRAISSWLKIRRWPIVRSAEVLALKYNPYHVPER
jgi:hypothetical protein